MDGRTLLFGRGWIGTQWAARLDDAVLSGADIADPAAVREAIADAAPVRVVNCAGKTGRPNVDALETQGAATYRSNVVGPINLASICAEQGLHFTHLGSGCVYQGDNGGTGFGEDDAPNYDGSLYSRSKAVGEAALRDLGALQLRLRLPLASTPHPRNLLTKLLGFTDVVSTPNSVTVLDDFWAPAEALIGQRADGVWNLVNPGVERHDEVLARWRAEIDPDHAFGVVSEADLAARLVAGRSNCVLRTDKLAAAGLALPDFSESLSRILPAYAAALRSASA